MLAAGIVEAQPLYASGIGESTGVAEWNIALSDLERGLRSARIGEQAEAIAKIPVLLRSHPFPIFINAAFLKLAEVYRASSNYLRQCIVHVAEYSEGEISKLISVDEILRRFFTVSFSNDPIARSLTLRLLAHFAVAIANRHNVHDFIRRSLDSNHIGELNQAIFAAKKFATVSPEFFATMLEKISGMLESPAVSAATKRKLLPILSRAKPSQINRLRQQGALSVGSKMTQTILMTNLICNSMEGVSEMIDSLLQELGQPSAERKMQLP